MRKAKETAVWTALKKLAMGLGLIVLFSSILLLSDLGHRKTASAASALARAQAGAAGRIIKTAIVYFARDAGTDLCVQGLIDGLKASGFEEGKNLEVRRADAQGEMINIPAILQNYDSSDVDVIMTITTPCLSGGFYLRHRSDCRWSGCEPHRPFAVRHRRWQFSAGGPHLGHDAETDSRLARCGHHV